MPIYELDGVKPELPQAGTFWSAPGAHVIGRVRLGREVGVWFGSAIQT
jgi:carbonic anhydrase/acetyltransferase-like protein (isoleucine patch superfamily)